ncbi:L-gulono-1,4-lactone dehydrogenase [Nematostella vectensis]|uniref:L-gulono-1,4-lactone dehydrogenase n=1 Tax=Nematostella vectensis TaxID=45351 RepID=UPI0013902D5C|nr:L-gulono-1,4-lactone dehydrogenase [Nematostella vectensis]
MLFWSRVNAERRRFSLYYNYDTGMSETGSCCSCLSSSGADTPTARVQLYVPSRVKFHSFPGELKTCADDPEISQRLSQGLSPTEQLSAICRFASRHNYTVQAKGTGSSMSRICSECDILIDMTSLDKIVTPRPAVREENLSKDYVDIEVEAGMRLKDFVETLDKHYGLALPVLGSNAGQTVAGAAMVSSHGSGLGAASLAASVVGVHLITSSGIQVKLSLGSESLLDCKQKLIHGQQDGNPVDMTSTHMLRAAIVGLGAMGIIYTLTYRCIPVYNLREERSVLRVPCRDKSTFSVTNQLARDFTSHEFFSILLNPYPQPQGFLYASVLKSRPTPFNPTCCQCCTCWCGSGGRGCADCDMCQSSCCLTCFQCITQCCPARSRDIINYGLTYFSLKKPFIHKWYNVLQLTKGTNSVRSAEWSLPLSRLDEALYDVIDTIKQLGLRNNEYTALPLHIRIAKTDDLMLSPANRKFQSGESQHCAYIEVPVLAGCKHTDDLYGAIESTLTTRYHARPHWGKYHSLTADSIRDLYPQLDDWKQVYRLLNSDGIFSSDFTDKMGFHLVLESEPGPSGENLNNDNHVITVQPAQ